MKHICTIILLLALYPLAVTQTNVPDTVIVQLANTSQVTFTMQDRSDLGQLRDYDYQALFDDIILQLETRDTTSPVVQPKDTMDAEPNVNVSPTELHQDDEADDDDDDDSEIYYTDTYDNHWKHWKDKGNKYPYTRQFFNMDFGINYLNENGSTPDPDADLYAVKPWGSWYIGLNTVQRTHFNQKFAVEWSFGISWYNFKFYEEALLISREEDEVVFQIDPRPLDFTKSKLTISHANAYFVPMYDAGGRYRDHGYRRWQNSSFRIGAGPYVGFRLDSYTKQQWDDDDGDKDFDRDHDHLYLEDIRYGIRFQMGFADLDVFFNYDLNDLFREDRGPEINAFSFGLVF